MPAVPSGSCASFYGSGFALTTGEVVQPFDGSGRPARGVAVADPAWGTCIVRATDHAADSVPGFARNDYSRRQAFNADSSKLIVYALDGSWRLYDASTYAHLKRLSGPAGDAEPQWHPTDPNLLYYLPTNGGLQVRELNVSTNTARTVGDFTGKLPWSDVRRLWTKSEGSPSADARYWAFMAETDGFASRGIVVWDRVNNTIVSTLNNTERPDHLSMSASGNYVVVSWLDRVVAYDRNLQNPRTIHGSSEHSDLGLDAAGNDMFVSIDYQSGDGAVFMTNLNTGVRTDLFPTYISRKATAMHFSAKAFNKPGWVVISTYADYSAVGGTSPQLWMDRKIFAVQMAASPTIYNLGFTRTVNGGYWSEPQASVNRDFTKIVWTSNWNNRGTATDANGDYTDLDTYMIQIPVGAIH
ncbi:MAG: hypothetical protein ABI574_14855 [Burkholderiales bacterium]